LYGFSEKEKSEDLGRYFSYITLLMAGVIIIEMIHLYLTSETIFVDGSIHKESVALGWGIWNLIGTSLAVMIPTLFLGVMNNKYPWLYFAAACLTYVFAVLTMSRNALVFATLAFVVSVIISCFVGKNKKAFRIITFIGIVGVLLFILLFFGKIKALLGDYFERGFSDNGRYDLWKLAIDTFKEHAVFGNGFYGFFTDAVYEFGGVPRMAHNTVLEILSAMGTVGILCYLWYRVSTAVTFFSRPNKMKTMLGLSILVFLLGSLLDNFVFNIHPALYYSVALAIAVRSDSEAN
jgi:O-antigen ligase